MPAPQHEHFNVEVGGRIATVQIDRPAARNALTAAMRRDFATLFRTFNDRDDIDVVVLTGADPAFCSGVDLKDRLADGTVPPRVEPNPAAVLRNMTITVIAAVNGACVTGGLEIAVAFGYLSHAQCANALELADRVRAMSYRLCTTKRE